MQNKNMSKPQWQKVDEIDDDRPIGRVLSRREMLALLGTTGATFFLGGCAVPGLGGRPPGGGPGSVESSTDLSALATVNASLPAGCVVRPEMTEGPYFVDEELNRSDIRSDPTDGTIKEGVPLALALNVSQINGQSCTPLAGATVDIWHCDALGVYSDVTDTGFDTIGQKFLRGYQVTDENGVVQFSTIYPGWYSGRTVHIHVKIRTEATDGAAYEFTSQLYFDDTLTDQIHAQEPYAGKGGERDTRNDTDMHYANGGDQLLLALAEDGEGYAATFEFALDLSDSEAGESDSF